MFPLHPFTRGAIASMVALAALLVVVPSAHAQVWTESADAGSLPATADHTVGTGSLLLINGTLLSNTDVDMYCIRVTNPATFSAFLTCLTLSEDDVWLFDATGLGLARDRGCQGSQTRVGSPFVSVTGIYYLAVSGNDASAQNAGSNLWQVGVPVTGQAAPNGPAAALPVTGWTGGTANPVSYSIQLVGASFCDSAVPVEPHSWSRVKIIYR